MKAVIVALLGYVPVRLLLYGFAGHARKKVALPVLAFGGLLYLTAVIVILDLNIVYSLGLILVFGIASMDGLFEWINRLYRRVKKARQNLKVASKKDQSWDETGLLNLIEKTIPRYISDWDQKNLKHLKEYGTQKFVYGNELAFNALDSRNYKTSTKGLNVASTKIIDVHDVIDNEQDHFIVLVEGSKSANLLKGKEVIYTSDGDFVELWHFDREDGQWRLDGIEKADEDERATNASIEHVSNESGYYKNDEWGVLFLPREGLIGDMFLGKTEDVTGFLLGIRHNLLIDVLAIKTGEKAEQEIIIGSLKLSKPAPHLVIRHTNIENVPTTKLKRLSIDWPSFSQQYEVFVDSNNHTVPLSILHESTLKLLSELSFPIVIEVIGDRIYGYTPNGDININVLMDTIINVEDRLWAQ